jgi:hypothetical protein
LREVLNDAVIAGGTPDNGAHHARVCVDEPGAGVLVAGQATVHEAPLVIGHYAGRP